MTSEEKEGGAKRVEVHLCRLCNQTTRFPRYNAALKLLSSRRGRCGEWAKVPSLFFLFFCSFVLLFFCSFVLLFFCSFVLLFFCSFVLTCVSSFSQGFLLYFAHSWNRNKVFHLATFLPPLFSSFISPSVLSIPPSFPLFSL